MYVYAYILQIYYQSRLRGPHDPSTAVQYYHLAQAFLVQNRIDEVEGIFDTIISIFRDALSVSDPHERGWDVLSLDLISLFNSLSLLVFLLFPPISACTRSCKEYWAEPDFFCVCIPMHFSSAGRFEGQEPSFCLDLLLSIARSRESSLGEFDRRTGNVYHVIGAVYSTLPSSHCSSWLVFVLSFLEQNLVPSSFSFSYLPISIFMLITYMDRSHVCLSIRNGKCGQLLGACSSCHFTFTRSWPSGISAAAAPIQRNFWIFYRIREDITGRVFVEVHIGWRSDSPSRRLEKWYHPWRIWCFLPSRRYHGSPILIYIYIYIYISLSHFPILSIFVSLFFIRDKISPLGELKNLPSFLLLFLSCTVILVANILLVVVYFSPSFLSFLWNDKLTS